jgi:hypothetical protein
MLIFLIFLFKRSANFKEFISTELSSKLLIISIILGISFLIFLIAPGNFVRDQFFPERHFINSLFISLKTAVKFFGLFIPARLVYVLAFGIPFIAIGNIYSGSSLNKIPFSKVFKIATIILSGFLILFFLIVAIVMVETGPPRVWFLLSFLLSVYTAIIGFYGGYSGYISHEKIKILKTGSLAIGSLIMIYCFAVKLPTAMIYSKAHDERIHYLTDLNKKINHDTLIWLKPLPSCGMLYSSEIKSDTNHFTNKEIRMGYDLKFHVAIQN